MNENEMLNATPVEVDEVTTPAVADEAAEAVEAAPEVGRPRPRRSRRRRS